MSSQWIDVAATSGGKYGAYLSLPPAGKGPGLVLFQEIFGVNRHIRAVADQYALDGFVVLAPDLFWRDAPRVELGYEGAERERALVLMKGADPKLLAEDIKTTVAALRARPETVGKVHGLFKSPLPKLHGRVCECLAVDIGIIRICPFIIPRPVRLRHVRQECVLIRLVVEQ